MDALNVFLCSLNLALAIAGFVTQKEKRGAWFSAIMGWFIALMWVVAYSH